MHVDFNQHSVTRLDNRLVFITYLNKNWRSSYGGALELWEYGRE
jgi:Rps23 Pro-64 3,4-dihydroxylase Tpa1-like proline 4-hydroxylase